MARLLFFTILLASIVLIQAGKKCHKCPKHEVWGHCGKHCEPQCPDPNPHGKCDDDDKGHDDKGDDDDSGGDDDDDDDDDDKGHKGDKGKHCKCEKHHAGCCCKKGYVRDKCTGKCVLPKDCTKCKHGEKCLPGGKKCEGTCKHPYPPKDCKKHCHWKGCRCDLENGYVRDEKTGLCVKIKDCPCKKRDDDDDDDDEYKKK